MTGDLLSIGAAFFWASSVILFKLSTSRFSPLSLNLFKCLVALVLIPVTMLVLGIDFFPDQPASDWFWLIASGIIGITLSDLFFFMALNRLGAGLTAVVDCLYMPCVIFFSFLLLSESLSVWAIAGGLLVFTAVLVGSIPPPGQSGERTGTAVPWLGLGLGVLAMITVALGIVIIKELLTRTDVFWATLVRIQAATLSLSAMVAVMPQRKQILKELKFSREWAFALPASICGNYLALLCWMGGMKYTTAARAAILNQMSTIFIFIMAAIFLKEKITRNRLAAIILAFTGACLTILGPA